jgi:acyl-CoA thioester hydrolase
MDALGHVNNTVYLQYVESARIGLFEKLGWGVERFRSEGQGPLIVSQSFQYRRQVMYPARLEVGMRAGEIRRRSFVLDYGLFLAGSEVSVGHGSCVLVWTDLAVGRGVELPVRIREMLLREGGQESPPTA